MWNARNLPRKSENCRNWDNQISEIYTFAKVGIKVNVEVGLVAVTVGVQAEPSAHEQ